MVPINHRRAWLVPCWRPARWRAEKPYRVSLIGDSFDGRSWQTGVLIELEPGWKTYWRMPGEAGIPPEFTWTTSAPAEVRVSFPRPARYADQSGETVGYEGAALFPVAVTPETATELRSRPRSVLRRVQGHLHSGLGQRLDHARHRDA